MSKYSPSSFVRKLQKEEEVEEKKFKQFVQKNVPAGPMAKEEKRHSAPAPAPTSDDELEIPAFIRKKMGS